MKQYLIIFFAVVFLVGCIATSSSFIHSNIYTYRYDRDMIVVSKLRVTAQRTKIINKNTDETQVGLTLKYDDEEGEEHKLFISSAYIDSFEDALLPKADINNKLDRPKKLQLGYRQINMLTNYINGKPIVSIGSLNGVFAFQEADIQEILSILNKIKNN